MGWAVAKNATGGFLAGGYTTGFGSSPGDIYLVQVNASGNLEWQRHFGYSGLDMAYDVQSTEDDRYIVAGISSEAGTEFQQAWLLSVDQTGDTIWSRLYGDFPKTFAYSVRQTMDEGFIVTGGSNSIGGTTYDVYLLKTDSQGIIVSDQAPYPLPQPLRVFPNPSYGLINISIPPETQRLIISDLTGRKIAVFPVIPLQIVQLDLSTLAKGSYLLVAESPDNYFPELLILQ